MTLSMDDEFAAAIAPLQGMLQNLPNPKIHDVEARRQAIAAMVPRMDTPEGISIKVHHIKTTDNYDLPIWHFKKDGNMSSSTAGEPAVLHIHGGGFICLSPAIMVPSLSNLVLETGIQVFSVEYRLAPEHPFPTPLEDCYESLQWLTGQARTFGIDATRIAVMGESAGGGLAAGLTLLARDRQLRPSIARQILGCPMLDDRNSKTLAKNIVSMWSEEDNITGWAAYLGSKYGKDNVPCYAAPARVDDVTLLPPLYIDIGQLDLFMKECHAYVGKFLAANIEVEFHIYPGLTHGFEGLAPNHSVAKEMKTKRWNQLRKL